MTDLDPLTETDVDTSAAYAANRSNWDDRAKVHAASREYDVDALIADPERISTVIAEDLAILTPHLRPSEVDRPLAGLDVCHLQCHIGTDTLSLARAGGRLTGVDLSPASLAIARDIATRADVDIRYVESEVTVAAPEVGATFDHVHTSIGTITWVQDLSAWARTVAALLRPGGTFFFRDGHPALATFDDTVSDAVVLGYRYFALPPGRAWTSADGITYTDGDHSQITATRNYEWPHPVSEILQALLDAGLELVAVGEHDRLNWPALPLMAEENGAFVLPEPWRQQVPLALSVVARKR
ncbi:MAG TPA: class I SAM-dependent methyltransferase [Candidatus Ruania gallistercoris]|uniref:Class I SAM-dependent methyltransferase n=1 Tax=Candidatus Ruania gallistercoris TaxID=2838746 RepID=A0A9D2J3N0_9MICO|nr:class I SAM-dependent methyltransferase [Candidatus Ruania gallistercoris]